jgi:hypothetical protein
MGHGSWERRIAELTAEGRKWTEREAREVLAAWEATGESGPAFGRRFGIVPQRLWWWRSRLSSTTSSFVPVEVRRAAEAAIVVTSERGLRIEGA